MQYLNVSAKYFFNKFVVFAKCTECDVAKCTECDVAKCTECDVFFLFKSKYLICFDFSSCYRFGVELTYARAAL